MAVLLPFVLGGLLLIVIGCVIVGAAYLYFIKDYYLEVEDIHTKEMFEKFPSLPLEKQDLIRDIIEDD